MTADRYVVLGLARPRAQWFGDITHWAASAAVPIEFVKCLAVDELRARLTSGRRWSAVLVDATVPGVDRDLVDVANQVGAVVLVIADPRVERRWGDLGAVSSLPSDLDAGALLTALAEHARPVRRSAPRLDTSEPTTAPPWRGTLVAVTGPGGTGASVVAAMLAQGFGSDVTHQGLVVLADLALDADQAVIHDPGDIVPGLPELVDAHRLGRPDPDEVRSLAFALPDRAHHLLLGLRRHSDWSTLRPRAVASAIGGLRRAYRVVVADIDPDVEGERETGSVDVEERNVLSRAATAEADTLVVVGVPGPVGTHRLAQLLRSLVAHGVDPRRMLPVVNRAPRAPRRRAEIARALGALSGVADLASPTFIPERRNLDALVEAAAPWPRSIVSTLHRAATAMVERTPPAPDRDLVPEPVAPGSLGHFDDLDEVSGA